MKESDNARPVMLDWTLWCPEHLEPYRAKWPSGAAIAMIKLFEAAAKMPAVVDAAKGDANFLTEALQRFKPLCCFISRTELRQIYKETLGKIP